MKEHTPSSSAEMRERVLAQMNHAQELVEQAAEQNKVREKVDDAAAQVILRALETCLGPDMEAMAVLAMDYKDKAFARDAGVVSRRVWANLLDAALDRIAGAVRDLEAKNKGCAEHD